MFLINTRPLRRTKTIAEYAQLLFNRFVLEHFQAGAREVHLLFDKPSSQEFNPKAFEHTRRDVGKSKGTPSYMNTSHFPQKLPHPKLGATTLNVGSVNGQLWRLLGSRI